MCGVVAERRRADFAIPALLPQVCSHIRGADAGGSAISWGQRWFGARGLEADAENWVSDSFVAERILLPLRLRSATAYVWTHVMICVEANFLPASTGVRSAHVWMYLYPSEAGRSDISQYTVGQSGSLDVPFDLRVSKLICHRLDVLPPVRCCHIDMLT